MTTPSLQRTLVLRLSLTMAALIAGGLAGSLWYAVAMKEAASNQTSHENAYDVIIDFLLHAAWALPFGGAFAVLVAAVVVRGALAPLRELAMQAQAIQPGTPPPRLANVTLPAEVMPMVIAFDEAASRLHAALAAQKRYTANAVHELRTPLTVLFGRLELLVENRLTAETILTLKADCMRMTRVLAQLTALEQAKAITASPDAGTLLAPLLREVVCGVAPLAASRDVGIAVTIAAEQLRVRGIAAAIEAMLKNVIENAVQHAPPGTEVKIRLCADASVKVEDAGPGIPVSLRSQVFERFWRGPWSRHTGTGLGLAIVNEAAEQIGATVTIGDAPSGGARFVLHFHPL